MRHVGSDQVSGGEGGAEGEFAGEDAGGDDSGETAGVIAWVGWVGPADAEKVEAGGLGFEDCAATDGADFDGGHRDGDLEVAVVAGVGGQ